MTKLYALTDPRHPLVIRYIGKTSYPLRDRLARHIYEAVSTKRNHRVNWLRKILAEGVRPVCELLDTVAGDGCAEERQMIAFCRLMGARLTNNTDGGEGRLGRRCSDEAKAAMSKKAKARMADPRVRAAASDATSQAWRDPVKRARMLANRAKVPSSSRY